MTAVVAIMNKSGLALAADSAVTVTNGTGGYSSSKIYNTANKLFMLSKHHPVGIMVYSSAHFMQTPWELIIKLYRKQLGNKSFNTIEEYKNDFLNFIVSDNKLSFREKEKSCLPISILHIVSYILTTADNLIRSDENANAELSILEEIDFEAGYIKILEKKLEFINHIYRSSYEKISSFSEYDFENFCNAYEKSVVDAFNNCNDNIKLDKYPSLQKHLTNLVYEYLTRDNFELGSTGIVFAGFGESEIYPSLNSIEIDGILNNQLRFSNNTVREISEDNTASIVPFAQIDVMQMFIEGIDPKIEKVFKDSFSKTLEGYTEMIIDAIDDESIKDVIRSINFEEANAGFQQDIYLAKQNWQILPTIQTVDILAKEDLAELAESLIYLTFLKRRTSSSEESVGGPVDVTIISKGDGFIWKNRKHYFDKNLNQHFFSNYFNN